MEKWKEKSELQTHRIKFIRKTNYYINIDIVKLKNMGIDMKRGNVINKYSCIEINFRYYCVHSKRGNHRILHLKEIK